MLETADRGSPVGESRQRRPRHSPPLCTKAQARELVDDATSPPSRPRLVGPDSRHDLPADIHSSVAGAPKPSKLSTSTAPGGSVDRHRSAGQGTHIAQQACAGTTSLNQARTRSPDPLGNPWSRPPPPLLTSGALWRPHRSDTQLITRSLRAVATSSPKRIIGCRTWAVTACRRPSQVAPATGRAVCRAVAHVAGYRTGSRVLGVERYRTVGWCGLSG